MQKEGFSGPLSLHLRCPRECSACGFLQHPPPPIFWLVSLTAESPSTTLAGPSEVERCQQSSPWGLMSIQLAEAPVPSQMMPREDGPSGLWAQPHCLLGTYGWEPGVQALLSLGFSGHSTHRPGREDLCEERMKDRERRGGAEDRSEQSCSRLHSFHSKPRLLGTFLVPGRRCQMSWGDSGEQDQKHSLIF